MTSSNATLSRSSPVPISRLRRLPESWGSTTRRLGSWVKQDEIDRGVRDGVSTSDREEVTELRRENARLRMERELLKRAVAFWVRESNE